MRRGSLLSVFKMIEVVGLVPSPTIGVEDNPDYLDEVRNPAGVSPSGYASLET